MNLHENKELFLTAINCHLASSATYVSSGTS